MTRMVEEQRVQIGALKALGYSRLSISRKYIGYGLLPSLVGGVLGLVIGYILFPKMIFTAYQIMYQMPDIELHAYTDISLFPCSQRSPAQQSRRSGPALPRCAKRRRA